MREPQFLGIAFASALLLGVAACEAPLTLDPVLLVNPTTLNVTRGTNQEIAVTFTGRNQEATYTVTSANPGIANVTRNQTGAVIEGLALGSTKVYVQVDRYSHIRDSVTVNVVNPGLALAPRELTVAQGESRPFTVTITGLTAPNFSVTSANEGVATATRTQTGATVQGVGVGTTQIYTDIEYGGMWIRGWQETNNDGVPLDNVTRSHGANFLTQDVAGNRTEAWRDFAAGAVPDPEFPSFTARGIQTFRSSVSRATFTSLEQTFTITASVVGTGQNAPFSRIWVYQGPSGGGFGSFWLTEITSAPTVTDNGDGTRTWTWTSAPIPGTAIDAWRITAGDVRMRLAGVTNDGYALLSTWSTITYTP